MRRGTIPEGRKWLNSLDTGTIPPTANGYFVVVGVVSEVENPVIWIQISNARVQGATIEGNIWKFSIEDDAFVDSGIPCTAELVSAITEAIGIDLPTAGTPGREYASLSKVSITGKYLVSAG